MFSLFKTVTKCNSTFSRQNQDTSIQCSSPPFLDGPRKIKGGESSSAQWQLGAKLLLLESTPSLAPERKLYSGKSSSPAALT